MNAAVRTIAELWSMNGDSRDADEYFRWAGASEAELMDEEIRRLTRERERMKN